MDSAASASIPPRLDYQGQSLQSARLSGRENMQLFTLLALGLTLVGFAIYKTVASYLELNSSRQPPGPMQVPFIGRIHDLPVKFMWLKFKEWADIYGQESGFYMTSMFGVKLLVVSDERVAEELLVKRGRYNSDRPAVRSLFDSKSTHGSMEYLPLMGRNQYWARQRKVSHAYLTEAANAQYHGIMYHESKRWLARLIENPEAFRESLDDMASKVMCQLTWDDPSISEYCTKSAWGLLTQMSPAGPITNVLTPLWDLPLLINPWKKAEIKRHDEQKGWWMERLRTVREKMALGQQRACWTRQYLESTAKTGKLSGDYEASCVLGMLALVGVFTVAGPLSYFLLAMVHHPHWQAAAQQEIDEACEGRLPTLDDTPNLPILRACIKETMRWKPNVPTGMAYATAMQWSSAYKHLGVAHETEADDIYKGYLIPRGTRILPLDWAFLRNPAKYPDPDNFRPERWLRPEWPTYQEPLSQYPTLRGMSSFGWGQRQCLGMNVTQDKLIVACGALMWCFNLRPRTDPLTGIASLPPLDRCNSLLIIKPEPFQMEFEPRNEERKQEALELWKKSEARDLQDRANFAARVARDAVDASLAAKAEAKANNGGRAPEPVPPPTSVPIHSRMDTVRLWKETLNIPAGC